MRKIVAILIVLLLAASFFAGCKRDAGTLIGIAMPETHVLRWVKDGNSLRDEAVTRGYRAEVQWADADQRIQNQQVSSFLTQGAKALIIGNINDGVGSAVAEASREGAIVIAYDRIIQGTHDYGYYITFNNYKVGQLQGQSIVDGLNLDAGTAASPRHIALFAGSPTDANANFFFQGAMDVLLPHIERGVLTVAGPFPRHYSEPAFQQIATEGWRADIAKARMEGLLIGDARAVVLDAVLAPNDTLGRAIIEALRADARYHARLPVVTGQDAEFDSIMSIKNGEQYSTVFKDTALLAAAAIILADQLLSGTAVDVPGTILAEGELSEIGFTGTGYVNTLLLDPILITRDNLNVPVDAGFFSEDEAAQIMR
ncbi:MAG: sugar-binding protein [Treponema sp.]|jgi:putative multiple sugar transport system substrate-binding protein|nr:sugar-binding protein [Treponema sp.]